MFNLRAALLIGAWAISGMGCSDPVQATDIASVEGVGIDAGPKPPSVGTAEPRGRFQQIVSPGSLGANLAYVENQIGQPAKFTRVDGLGITRNLYEVSGCVVNVGVLEGKVVSIGMMLKPNVCDLDVSEILGVRSPILASATTYRDWSSRGQLHFTDDQIPSCNACGEGFPNAIIDGYSAGGLFDIMLSGWGDFSKASQWKDAIWNSGIDLDKLPTTKECPLRQFDGLAYSLMADTPVEGVEFGRIGAVQPVCSARPVQQYRSGGYVGQ
jgi:hypothetical protein